MDKSGNLTQHISVEDISVSERILSVQPLPFDADILEDASFQQQRVYKVLTGKVRNNGDAGLKHVKLTVNWHDDNGRTIDTVWAWVVGPGGLRSGAAKAFEIMAQSDSRISGFHYYPSNAELSD